MMENIVSSVKVLHTEFCYNVSYEHFESAKFSLGCGLTTLTNARFDL